MGTQIFDFLHEGKLSCHRIPGIEAQLALPVIIFPDRNINERVVFTRFPAPSPEAGQTDGGGIFRDLKGQPLLRDRQINGHAGDIRLQIIKFVSLHAVERPVLRPISWRSDDLLELSVDDLKLGRLCPVYHPAIQHRIFCELLGRDVFTRQPALRSP